GAAREVVALDQHLVGGVEEQERGAVAEALQLGEGRRRLLDEGARADVDRDAQALGLRRHALHQRQPQGGREVVDGVEADVLEGVQRGGLARPAHAGEDDQRCARARSFLAHGSLMGSRLHATSASPSSVIATRPTLARSRPGQSTSPPPGVSCRTSSAPPTCACEKRSLARAASSAGSGSPSCSTRQRSPVWTTCASTPATCTWKAGTAPARVTASQEEGLRKPTTMSTHLWVGAPGASSTGTAVSVTRPRRASAIASAASREVKQPTRTRTNRRPESMATSV